MMTFISFSCLLSRVLRAGVHNCGNHREGCLVIVAIGSESAKGGGYVAVRIREKSAGNDLQLPLGQVPGKLTAEYSIILRIRHDFLLAWYSIQIVCPW
jgi:hypothetical protein